MTRRLSLGKVAGVFGVRGWLRIQSFTRPVENLLEYEPWWIAHGQGFEAKVLEGRIQRNGLVVRISGLDGGPIDNRDVAANLVGAEVQVPREAFPQAGEGEYYWADLIGLEVRNVEAVVLGVVVSLVNNGAQDVLVVRGADAVERLIPFVHGAIVRSVSLPAKLIVVDWQPDW